MTVDGKTRGTEFPATNAHGACVAAFSDALLDGRDPAPSGIDGLRSVQVTDAMARSAWGGVHVRLAY
jgi:predicted dehydrogenase